MQLAKHLGKHKISKKTIVGKKKEQFPAQESMRLPHERELYTGRSNNIYPLNIIEK